LLSSRRSRAASSRASSQPRSSSASQVSPADLAHAGPRGRCGPVAGARGARAAARETASRPAPSAIAGPDPRESKRDHRHRDAMPRRHRSPVPWPPTPALTGIPPDGSHPTECDAPGAGRRVGRPIGLSHDAPCRARPNGLRLGVRD
jgi:hypothetical protein